MIGSVPLGILDRSVPSGTHICAFYSGSAGRDQVVMPFPAGACGPGRNASAFSTHHMVIADGVVHENP